MLGSDVAPRVDNREQAQRRHDVAVAKLRASYAAIPRGAPVRLAKPTSNLFRPRRPVSTPGLDVSELDGVITVDAAARTADVQGMCTYERLVDATLPHGLMPLVVPQLKSITLGGAVSGLGIESSSYRNGLPHESVVEMDVLTGDGRVLTCTPDGPHAELFRAFPNSYGSLGYALRLRIELEPVSPYVMIRHVPFVDLDDMARTLRRICDERAWQGAEVHFVDGVVFDRAESYLTLGSWARDVHGTGLLRASDYTGQHIYYRSIRERSRDLLTVRDYLWRWDTDWFWCSRAFGAQHPVVRRVWPAKYRRSDVYHKIVGLENRYGVARRADRLLRRPARERVIQDVEIPVERLADFLRWFAANVPMQPVWLCPLRLRRPPSGAAPTEWPLYPLDPDRLYVNVGFWGTVPIESGRYDGDVNRAVEQAVAEHEGHKSLYSDAYYDEESFEAIYGGKVYHAVKDEYDPEHRLNGLYEKAVGRR